MRLLQKNQNSPQQLQPKHRNRTQTEQTGMKA